MELERGDYHSPRWSWEILDCAMPMTFDTYSNCAHQCVYSNSPESLILGADLRYRPHGEIRVGDSLLGFERDEEPRLRTPGTDPMRIQNGRQRWTVTTVLTVVHRKAPRQKVFFSSGREAICTPDHRWYLSSAQDNHPGFRLSKVGRLGHNLPLPLYLAETVTNDYRHGYLRGLLDGDGNLDLGNATVRIVMNDEPAVARATAYLRHFGIRHSWHLRPDPGVHGRPNVITVCGQDQLPFWDYSPDSDAWWRGWMAGMIDAEGNSPQFGLRTNAMTISQDQTANPEIHQRLHGVLVRFGFSHVMEPRWARIQGGVWEQARLCQWAQPTIPRKSTGGLVNNTMVAGRDEIVAVEPLPDGDVVSIGTSTHNYVADGLASHNCFAFFQRAIGNTSKAYLHHKVKAVNVDRVKRIFTLDPSLENSGWAQFFWYIKARYVLQWGGLSDGFDWYERKFRTSLELLKFFVEQDYPISISTKGVWFLKDPEYRAVLKDAKNVHFKYSIITLDEAAAAKLEAGVPTPEERFWALEELNKLGIGWTTWRFRPFVPGVSDQNLEQMFQRAHDAGVGSLTTEFLCLEKRASENHLARYKAMSEVSGFDFWEFYRRNSYSGSGLMRLNYDYKRPYIARMKDLAAHYDMPFYVSDAHHKEQSAAAGCCGLPSTGPLSNYNKGQYAEAILIAKRNGRVFWSDIADAAEGLKNIPFYKAEGYNQGDTQNRVKHRYHTMFDYMHDIWNTPRSWSSPARYFGGALVPGDPDENGDVVYVYNAPFVEDGLRPESMKDIVALVDAQQARKADGEDLGHVAYPIFVDARDQDTLVAPSALDAARLHYVLLTNGGGFDAARYAHVEQRPLGRLSPREVVLRHLKDEQLAGAWLVDGTTGRWVLNGAPKANVRAALSGAEGLMTADVEADVPGATFLTALPQQVGL